ncbi:MAG: S41 family peptidase [Anaerolineaceae bacterium]
MSKTLRNVLIVIVSIVLLVGAFSAGMVSGWMFPLKGGTQFTIPGLSPTADASTPTASSTDVESLFKPFWKSWDIVHDEYYQQPVDDAKLMQGAIRGMLEALGDEHTSYMDPDMLRQVNSQMEGGYEGIGAWVDTSGEFLTIISPMPGSPAEKAGLKPGDEVHAVDGKDMTGMDGSLVLRQILGPAGTDVTLTIVRKDTPEPFDVTITRAKIEVPTVESKMLDNNIGYIRISTFGETTDSELKKALTELEKQNPVGLVLDLRYNGGGYLQTAVDVGSEFIEKNSVLLYEEYGNGEKNTFKTHSGGLATEIPLVVLVNKGSASASEILAGAIQDYGRGKLVGTVTYGKGSVQNWITLDNDQGAIRVTVAHWLTPKERQINKVGLTPDVEVSLTDEDIQANRDPQLDRAVEVLKESIK